MKVRLLKALCFGGARQDAGSEMDLQVPLARELFARGCAEPVGEYTPPTGPMTLETAAALVPAPEPKGKANARK